MCFLHASKKIYFNMVSCINSGFVYKVYDCSIITTALLHRLFWNINVSKLHLRHAPSPSLTVKQLNLNWKHTGAHYTSSILE